MKTNLKLAIMTSLLFSMVVGTMFANAFELSKPLCIGVAILLSLFVSVPKGALAVVALNELVVAELIRQFDNDQDDFMAAIPDKSNWVGNNVIRLNDIGADPEVLINNTTYPINTVGRTDDSVVISLKKLETENTPITDDELNALPYDKKSSVMERHKMALKKASIKLAVHSFAPSADGANTPVISTTGTLDGSRKRLAVADLIKLKARLDALNIDKEGRKLILCNEHITDLLLIDQAFKDKYHNTETGKVLNLYGFEMYENQYNAVWNAGTKQAYAAAPAVGDFNGSTAFFAGMSAKARGTIKMYYRDAATDPENRESVVGFRMWFLATPIKTIGTGAIISN